MLSLSELSYSKYNAEFPAKLSSLRFQERCRSGRTGQIRQIYRE